MTPPRVKLVTLLGCVAAGLIAALLTPPSARPDQPAEAKPAPSPRPVIVVLTEHAGMPASSMEQDITNRVERWVSQAPGIEEVRSRSIPGLSIVELTLREKAGPEATFKQVKSLAKAALANLPPGTAEPSVFWRGVPVGIVTVTGKEASDSQLQDFARDRVAAALRKVPGVAEAALIGPRSRAVRVRLDPAKLKARGLTVSDVLKALAADEPLPSVHAIGASDLLLDSEDALRKARQLGDFPVRKNGGPVLLKDVGVVEEALGPADARVRIDGRRAVGVLVCRRSDASAADVARAVAEAARKSADGKCPPEVRFWPSGPNQVVLTVRTPPGNGRDGAERRVAEVERALTEWVPAEDREAIISEIGSGSGPAAAYGPNAGPADAVIRVRLSPKPRHGPAEYAAKLRRHFREAKRFADLEMAFNVGQPAEVGDGSAAPFVVRVEGRPAEAGRKLAGELRKRLGEIPGAADVRIRQRDGAPYLLFEVDRQKAAAVGLNATDVLKQVEAGIRAKGRLPADAWFDFVGPGRFTLTFPAAAAPDPLELLKLPVAAANAPAKLKLGSLVTVRQETRPLEIDHRNLLPVFEVLVNVDGRKPGEVAAEVRKELEKVRPSSGLKVALEVR